MSKPIRIFVGVEPKTEIAFKVLEHTIRKHASREVEITPMIGPAWEYSLEGIKVGTGFSLRRWMIPAACGWEGHAVYLDSDQIVFGDIAELYEKAQELMPAEPTAPVIACTFQPDKYSKTPWPQTSVMVIDCFRAFVHTHFDIKRVLQWLRKFPGAKHYADLMHGVGLPIAEPLPVEWNHLNVYKDGVTKLLHYTKEPEQPWYKPDHPLAGLWKKEFVECLEAGKVTRADVEKMLAQWNKKEDWRSTNGLHPHYKKFLVSAVK